MFKGVIGSSMLGRRLLWPLAVLAGLATSPVTAAEPPAADACRLEAPPPDAGEMAYASGVVTLEGRIYPRLSQMASGYTGCQILWATVNGRVTRSIVRLRDGRVEAVEPKPVPELCAKGERSIDTGCTSRRESIQLSFPAGCVARRLAGEYPPDCTRAFLQEEAMLKAWRDD